MGRKIAIRGGHNPQAQGAIGILNEVEVDRLITAATIKYLKAGGANVLDVTPGRMNTNADLAYGVNKANAWGANLFVSIHCNKAYNSYNGSIGSEVCVYSPFTEAQRVVNKLGSLGFKNRGQKCFPGYYELRNTAMPAMIVETFFLEATGDVALYRKLGADRMGKAIAEGILGTNVNSSKPIASPKKTNPTNTRQTGPNPNIVWDYAYEGKIAELQKILRNAGHNIGVDGKSGNRTYNECKKYTVRLNDRGKLIKWVQERLNNMGYNAGYADGYAEQPTMDGIARFQKAYKLGVGYLGGTDWYYLIK